MKHFLILLSLLGYVNAKDIIYTKQHIHAFLPPNNELNIQADIHLMNDTIDLLNIKEKELGSSSSVNNMGDLTGFEFNIGYAFFDDFYINTNLNQQKIEYSQTDLVNTNFNIYLRYQIYQNTKTAYAIDGGFDLNKADDLKVTDVTSINKFLKDEGASYNTTFGRFVYNDSSGVQQTFIYTVAPYVTLEDTQDYSFYLRGIVSYKTKKSLYDLYAGYKQINVDITTDTSVAHESNAGVVAKYNTLKDKLPSSRTESMLFAGVNMVTQFGSFFTEVSYKYNKLLRSGELSRYDTNHILDINLIYALSDSIAIYAGGKVMTNQFNGEINYLYTKPTESSFDKKYGYARSGVMFRF